jgi:prefoldin alpha subunit
MVPLTASLYVPGTLADPGRVVLEVGTGYYVETSIEKGKDFCARKVELVRSQLDALGEMAASRADAVRRVDVVMAQHKRGGGSGGSGSGSGSVRR